MSDEHTLTFRSGRVSFEWTEGTNIIVLEHQDSHGVGLPIDVPSGLKFDSEAFTLWACEFLGMVMADKPTFTIVKGPIARGDEEDSFEVVLVGPICDLDKGMVLTTVPEARA